MEVWQELLPTRITETKRRHNKVEAFLREHLQLVSNALLLEIGAKEHLSNRQNGCNTTTRLPAVNKAYRAQPKPDR